VEVAQPWMGVGDAPSECGNRLSLCVVNVTTQNFINFWGKIFVFILLVLIENSQGFKTF
jgi:hypothetical protein